MNQIRIIENYGVDNDGFQIYIAMLNDVGIIISHQEDNIDNIHLNVNINDFEDIIIYLSNMEYQIEEIFFNMRVFQECDSYTLDIHFTENTKEKLKNILSYNQKELKKDIYNFFRYYDFYKLGLQLELYASPDSDMVYIWNKNIEKIDNLAHKYKIYKNYIDVENKYGVDCFENYIIPKTYKFFKRMKEELLHKGGD